MGNKFTMLAQKMLQLRPENRKERRAVTTFNGFKLKINFVNRSLRSSPYHRSMELSSPFDSWSVGRSDLRRQLRRDQTVGNFTSHR